MTGHNRIPTKAPLISERRFKDLAASMILSVVFGLIVFVVLA